MSRALTVGLVQCWSQSSSFCAGRSFRATPPDSTGGALPLPSRSKRVATAVVLSLVRRDYRRQFLRRGVGGIGVDVIGVDRDRLVEVKDFGTKVDGDHEAVCRRRRFRSVRCDLAQLARAFDAMSR